MSQSKFKKNSIALLALSAFCATASAQVLIKGTVDQSYEKFETKTNPTASASQPTGTDSINRASSTLANYNWLSFSGNEDLGDGLKATYEMSLKYVGPDTENRSPKNYLSHVGLEGAFGKVKLGRQWRPLFTAVAAIDPTQLSATPGFAGAGRSGTGLSGLAPEPNNNTITYSLPSLTPGLFIQVQKGFSDSTQGESQGAHAIFTDGQKFFVTYAMHSEKMIASTSAKPSIFAASATGTNGTVEAISKATLGGANGLNHILYTSLSGGETRESSGLAGSYDFGIVKVVGGVVTEKVKGTKAKLDMNVIGLKLPIIENVNLGYLYSKAEHTRDPSAVNAVTSPIHKTNFNISGQKLLLTYDFSKRTTAYVAYGKQKLDGGTAAGNEFSSAISALGLRHNF
jgi:predicted porin